MFKRFYKFLTGTSFEEVVKQGVENVKNFINTFLTIDIDFNKVAKVFEQVSQKYKSFSISVVYNKLKFLFKKTLGITEIPNYLIDLSNFIKFTYSILITEFIQPLVFGEVEGIKIPIFAFPHHVYDFIIFRTVKNVKIAVPAFVGGISFKLGDIDEVINGPMIIIPILVHEPRDVAIHILHEFTHISLGLINKHLFFDEDIPTYVGVVTRSIAEVDDRVRKYVISESENIEIEDKYTLNFIERNFNILKEITEKCREDFQCLEHELLAKLHIYSTRHLILLIDEYISKCVEKKVEYVYQVPNAIVECWKINKNKLHGLTHVTSL